MIRRSLWWLILLFGAATAGVYLLFVRTGVGQRLDMAALAATGALPDSVIVDAGSVLDAVGITTLAFIAFVIGAFATMRGRYGLAISAAVVVAGSNLTTQVLKHSVLARPHLIPGGVLHPNSFPSGHATVAASLAVGAFLVVPHRLRAPTALAATTFAAGVGVATVVAGWHRPSDVIGAWLVVGTWAAAVLAVLLAIRGSDTAPASDPWRARGEAVLAFGAFASLAVFATTASVWVWTRLTDHAELGRVGRGLAFVVAAAGIVGTALAVAAGIVFSLRRLTFAPRRG